MNVPDAHTTGYISIGEVISSQFVGSEPGAVVVAVPVRFTNAQLCVLDGVPLPTIKPAGYAVYADDHVIGRMF